MKFVTLKSFDKKKILIPTLIIASLILVITIFVSHAEFTSIDHVTIVDGVINYIPYDFKILNIYKLKDNCIGDTCYEEVNSMPGYGYVVNKDKTYCYVDLDDEAHQIKNKIYTNEDSEIVISELPKRSKCVIYFDDAMERVESKYFLGYGTQISPYKIQNIEDLVELSREVKNNNAFEGRYFELTKNLDFKEPSSYEDSTRVDFGNINEDNLNETLIKELTNTNGAGFVPIGYNVSNAGTPFKGIFDGNNNRIDNLFMQKYSGLDLDDNIRLGLFGIVENAEIKNLTVSGEIVVEDRGVIDGVQTVNRAILGGIVSNAAGTVKLSNLHNYVNTTTFNSRDSAAGILGSINTESNVTIENCENYGTIKNSNQIGGIVGFNQGTLTILNSINRGLISNEKGTSGVGGILGVEDGGTTIIKNSQNYGKVTTGLSTASEIKLGGIVGNLRSKELSILEDCDNYGEVVATTAETNTGMNLNYGGIIGRIDGTHGGIVYASNVHNHGNITGIGGNQARVGGIVGHMRVNGTLILDKSSNEGTLNISGDQYTGIEYGVGGLAGYVGRGSLYILNSYNKGKIIRENRKSNSSRLLIGGVIGNVYNGNSIGVVNSFNVGDIATDSTSTYYAGGILNLTYNGPSRIILNNTYNLGTLNAQHSYGVGYYGYTYNYNINNTYYQDSLSTDFGKNEATKLSESIMKSQEFVNILNSNTTNINLTDIFSNESTEVKEIVSKIKIIPWKLSDNKYPTLNY